MGNAAHRERCDHGAFICASEPLTRSHEQWHLIEENSMICYSMDHGLQAAATPSPSPTEHAAPASASAAPAAAAPAAVSTSTTAAATARAATTAPAAATARAAPTAESAGGQPLHVTAGCQPAASGNGSNGPCLDSLFSGVPIVRAPLLTALGTPSSPPLATPPYPLVPRGRYACALARLTWRLSRTGCYNADAAPPARASPPARHPD